MPFSRYLGDDHSDHDDHIRDHDQDCLDHNVTFSTNVQFQLPQLILNAPAVPPGGGAEALPAGFYPPSSSFSWFASPQGYSNNFSLQSATSSTSYPIAQPPPPASSAYSYSHTNTPPYSHPHSHHASELTAHHPYPSHLPLSIPSALGLPVYSASGFDLLSILARVVNRPFPKIYLGPVDLSCSFVVTDTRRFDSPIVYASPTFYKLTGYDEHEVVGRNCRFLQAPGGHVQRGQDRLHTAQDAVAHLRKNIIADKECQVSIINYRKDGSAFINMVSVIPIRGGVHNSPEEADDIVYHVGFQVDLSEQPKAILSKLKDGTYLVNYSDKSIAPPVPTGPRDWRTSSMTMRGMSKELRALLAEPAFANSFQLSTSTHASTAIALSTHPSEPISLDPYDGNKPIHMFLLDRSPDFIHVVSLKGAFLYAAPAVRSVLGYDPDELVGRSLTDFCHPADCVPLMRELKEASATPGPGLHPSGAPVSSSSASAGVSPTAETASAASAVQALASGAAPRPVDLLFRMQAKGRGYVWIECRGRLHVEPGKGRKAIILSGRLRNLPHLDWGPISRAGGLVSPLYKPLPPPIHNSLDGPQELSNNSPPSEREFWGMLSPNATFLYAGAAVRDVLGWGAGEIIGKPLADLVSGASPQDVRTAVQVEMNKVLATAGVESAGLACDVHTKERGTVSVHIVLYRSCAPPSQQQQGPEGVTDEPAGNGGDAAAQAPVVCQVKLCQGAAGTPPATLPLVHAPEESVFEETDLDRGSSWQYELQQLKYRNQRLVEEVVALEAAITKKMRRKQSLGALAAASTSSSTSSAASAAVTGATGPTMTGVAGLGISATARTSAAVGGLAVAYRHPASGMQQPPQSQSSQQPLNVRFVSGTQGVPLASASSAAASSMSAPVRARTMSNAGQVASSGQAYVSPTQPQLQHQQPVSATYTPHGRHAHAFESALQGWSQYAYDQLEHSPSSESGNGLASRTASAGYGGVPMKRPWDASMRDPGGGGGGGGGGA
ncbi:hypothetical protein C8Q73DRAFT_288713 [Cubamyces lactineus]|nr:hypothetical protein C8Q73DRAFT_288713 [Cubamyces lactineus]